ncbi:MAG: SpoIIE family protein phosphatase [Solirubrobacterales bacterium]
MSSQVERTLLPRAAMVDPEHRLATQHAAVSALAESGSVEDAVPRLLEAVGTGLGWEFGALWMPNGNGRARLRCVQTWTAPAIEGGGFADVCAETELAPGVGLPGRVWESGAPSWMMDVATDPGFSRTAAAARAGLHSAFAFPVVHAGKVLGVLEFFTRDIREPDEAVLADFATFGFQMGQFIDREAVRQELSESRDQLDAILRSVPAGLMVLDRRGTIVFANDTAARMTGRRGSDDLLRQEAAEVFGSWEIFDEQGEPMPGEDLPTAKALRGVEGPAVLLKVPGVKHAESHWLMARATPVPDGRGGFVAVGVFEEISEIKRTEEALRESEIRHRSISRTLQGGLAPPRVPEVPGLEIAVRFRALGEANEIGGDFYDLFQTGERRWGVIIGDVSGKGVEAAAVAALARHTVRATAQHEDDPGHVLTMLNEAVGRQLPSSRFCTAVYATIELGELWVRMQVASAGHPSPLLLRRHGGVEEVGRHGPLLAGFSDAGYTAEPAHLAAGDSLVLYTDGVIEAGERATETQALAPARLAAMLGACTSLDAEGIAKRIEHAVVEAEAGDPRDDAAILVLRSPQEV